MDALVIRVLEVFFFLLAHLLDLLLRILLYEFFVIDLMLLDQFSVDLHQLVKFGLEIVDLLYVILLLVLGLLLGLLIEKIRMSFK